MIDKEKIKFVLNNLGRDIEEKEEKIERELKTAKIRIEDAITRFRKNSGYKVAEGIKPRIEYIEDLERQLDHLKDKKEMLKNAVEID